MEILRKLEEFVSLQHIQHVVQTEPLIWEVEFTDFDRWVNSGPLCYRRKLLNPLSHFYCSNITNHSCNLIKVIEVIERSTVESI